MKTLSLYFACFAIVLLFGLANLSANDTIKEKILQLFPEADTNGDGVLSDAEEAVMSRQVLKRYPCTISRRARYVAAPRVMPTLVRSQQATNREAWKVLRRVQQAFPHDL